MLKAKEKQVQINTLIGRGCELTGDFFVQGSARIDGKINGNVKATGTLIVGSTGNISGTVDAKIVVIGGEVLGDVIAPDKTELTATAKVLGDIATKVIVIDENAVFQGKCDMNQTAPDKKTKSKIMRTTRTGRKTAKAAIAEALKEFEEESKFEEESNREAAIQESAAEENNIEQNATNA